MRTTRRFRLCVLALTASLLAACASGGTSDSEDSVADATGVPQPGGTARILQASEPRTLDPALMTNAVSNDALVGNSLFGQLLTVDDDGQIEHGLAEDLTSSDGGTTWQLTLREGLQFSDGTPFDAAAVQANWARIQDASTGSASRVYAGFVDSMTASGRVLEFSLSLPIAQFENSIVQGAMNWIAQPEALRAGPQEFDANPIGAGPFLLESWTRGGQMVLRKNPTYYDSPRPYLDELVLTANTDDAQRLTTLQTGGVDAITSSAPHLVAEATAQGMGATTQDLSGATLLAMNSRTAPFDDVRARRAVLQGVDLEVINAAAYQGTGEIPETLFASDSPYNGDTQLPGHDPAAAQQLFDELAAEGHAVEFTITTFAVTASRRMAESVQAQLNQYDNVDVEIEVLDYPAAMAQMAQRSFDMILSGISFADPVPILYNSLFSTSPGNLTGISDPELDAALLTGLSATDEDSRTQAYRQVAERYNELAPNLNVTRWNVGLVHSPELHGVEMYGSGAIRTDTMWMSP